MNWKHKSALRELLRIAGTVLFALLIGFIITVIVSEEPVKAFRAFLFGPLTKIKRFGSWIEESITLTFVGLAICIVFKAEQFSMGVEGQLYMGALGAGLVGLFVPLPHVFHVAVAMIAAAAAGFLWGLIPGALKAYLNANELVSSLMLNTIAIKFYNLLLTNWLKPPTAGYIVSDYLMDTALLARLIPRTRVTSALYLAIAAVLAVYWLMYRTPFGYALRTTGVNINFARYGGINTKRTIVLSMAVSGILAGLAGAEMAMGIHKKLIMNISMGMGFEGIVVSLLARNNPLAVPVAALFYGYLRAGADVMERTTDVTRELVLVIQAIIILLVTAESFLAFMRRRAARKREVSENVV